MLTKLGCPLHNQEPLDFACLAQNCDTRGLICYLCKLSQHHQHAPIVSLKMFVHSFLGSRATNECFIRQAAQIDEELLRILHKITKLKNRFHDFNIVEQTYHRFWKETVDQITEYDSILNELETLIAEKNDQQLKMLNTWILKHCHMYQTEKEEEQNENVYLAYLKNKHTAIVKISESIHKFEEKANFEDTDLLSLFKNEKAEHKLKLRFSDSLKGTCMSIQSATRASMTTSGNQRMMLLEPALSNNRALKRWKVKIEKMASWIGVGVGHLDSIKAVNFDFSYTNANHGNYLISSNGYSWNGYKMEFNSKFEPFTFTTGDTIMVIYDPANNKVTFQKEGHDQVFSYDVDPNQKPIHAAINMTGIGDCVQIVT